MRFLRKLYQYYVVDEDCFFFDNLKKKKNIDKRCIGVLSLVPL